VYGPKALLQAEGPLVRRGGAVILTTARLAKLQVLGGAALGRSSSNRLVVRLAATSQRRGREQRIEADALQAAGG
jgi:hypothetical protein